MPPRLDRPRVRCAVYTRQSVNRELDYSSCDAQREACEAFVGSMQYEGWELVDCRFDDVGVGGGSLERPALMRLVAAISSGLVDAVVVQRFDRLTRSVLDWSRLHELFERTGVELVVVAAGRDGMCSVMRGLMNNVLAAFGEFERELIGERLRDARAAKRARGLRSAGRVPFGYRSDPATRQLVPHPTEADVVREFFRRAAAGHSGAAIARWANDQGIRTKPTRNCEGKPWSGRTVLLLLRSPLNVGMRTAGPVLVPGAHEAIVDKATAEAAWEALARRRTRDPRPLGSLLPPDRDPYLLRGVVYCSGCHGNLSTSASAAVTLENLDRVPRYYRCRGTAERPACRPQVHVAASEVEALVLHQLQHPEQIAGASPVALQVLAALVPVWPTLTRGETNEVVRLLVWAAMWDHARRRVTLELDELGLERFADEYRVELGLGSGT